VFVLSEPQNRNGAGSQVVYSSFKVGDELRIIDPAETFRVLPELLKRLCQLRSPSVEIALAEVMHSDGGLN
jgi:hypothetical protein